MVYRPFLSFLFTLSLLLPSSRSLFCDVELGPETLAAGISGTILSQLNKELAKAATDSKIKSPTTQAITKAEFTILLNEITKSCVSSFFPNTITQAYERGTKGSLVIDVYTAVSEATKAFPLIKRPISEKPLIEGPLIFEQSPYGIPSSTSAPAIPEPFDYELATIFNYGFLHAVVGFSTTLLSRILVGKSLPMVMSEPQQIQYKMAMTAASMLLTDWFNEGVKTLIHNSPQTPAEEAYFYKKMCSLGNKLFNSVDKVFAASVALQRADAPSMAALAALLGVAYIHPNPLYQKSILTTDELVNEITNNIKNNNYQEAYEVAFNNPRILIQLSSQQQEALQELLHQAEKIVVSSAHKNPQESTAHLSTLLNLWRIITHKTTP